MMPLTDTQEDPEPHLDYILRSGHPRIVKTHLGSTFYERSLKLCGNGVKVVVPIRNPKDTLVSFYHFHQHNASLGNFTGSWDQFFQSMFLTKRLVFGDYFDFYEGWWKFKQDSPGQVMFVHYEDMKRDAPETIRRVADFLGKQIPDGHLKTIVEFTAFDSMKKNTKLLKASKSGANDALIFRKGTTGDSKNFFSPAQSEIVDTLVKDRFEPMGLTVKYE